MKILPQQLDEELTIIESKENPVKPLEANEMEVLKWYEIADEYWKEYLTDMRRKAAIEKLVSKQL